MTNEEAIGIAIELEKRVAQVYREAAASTDDEVGRRIFSALAEEEEGHVAYLQHKAQQLSAGDALTAEPLTTVVPTPESLVQTSDGADGAAPLDRSQEMEYLRQALQAEEETSAFYERMVAELDRSGRELFTRFLEIERGHRAIVQAEIDALSGAGFWFDFQEFDLERG